MKEKEQPIRHQKDPRSTEPRVKTYYSRERSSDISWIPNKDSGNLQGPVGFPWLLESAVDGKIPQPKINWNYALQVDGPTTEKIYGEWKGEESLSPAGRMHLGTARYVFEKLAKHLVATDGQIPDEILFANHPFDEFIKLVADDILSDAHNRYAQQEFEYILAQINSLNQQFSEVWLAAVSNLAPSPQPQASNERYVHPQTRFNQQLLAADFVIRQAQKPASLVEPSKVSGHVSASQKIIDQIEGQRFQLVNPIPNDLVSEFALPKSALHHVSGGRTM